MLIGADNPLEQHLMDNPHALISRNLEQTVINPTNPVVLRAHLRAAAHEAHARHARMPQSAAVEWLSKEN